MTLVKKQRVPATPTLGTPKRQISQVKPQGVATTFSPKKPSAASRKRETLRDQLWPGSADEIWSRKTNDGFTTIPRLLALIAHLIRSLSQRGDPSKAYVELWCRAWDEGIVQVQDEAAHAFASGYTSNRAERTWREAVFQLVELGFIKTHAIGNREIGVILMVDPLKACAAIRASSNHRVPDEWWNAFVHRANEIGAVLPKSQ